MKNRQTKQHTVFQGFITRGITIVCPVCFKAKISKRKHLFKRTRYILIDNRAPVSFLCHCKTANVITKPTMLHFKVSE